MAASAGWYPQADGQHRYWDGAAWTEHVSGSGTGVAVAEYGQDVANSSSLSPQTRLLEGLHKKAVSALQENLVGGEQIEVVIKGTANQAVIGTDRRAFIFKKGFLAGAAFGSELTSWSYNALVGVQIHTGMMSGAVILQAPGQSGVSTSYWANSDSDPHKAPNAIPLARPFDEAKAGVARLRELIALAHSPVERPAQSAGSPSLADELHKLAQLRDATIITDAEFEAQKRKLLA
jgi:hypothetical protein